jgi:hypothetical protein
VLVPIELVSRWIDDAEWDGQEAAVLLRLGHPQIAWLREFREEEFEGPGETWQPPFDYSRDDVRFAAIRRPDV